jgi:hypothetical protein
LRCHNRGSARLMKLSRCNASRVERGLCARRLCPWWCHRVAALTALLHIPATDRSRLSHGHPLCNGPQFDDETRTKESRNIPWRPGVVTGNNRSKSRIPYNVKRPIWLHPHWLCPSLWPELPTLQLGFPFPPRVENYTDTYSWRSLVFEQATKKP